MDELNLFKLMIFSLFISTLFMVLGIIFNSVSLCSVGYAFYTTSFVSLVFIKKKEGC